MTDKTQIFNSIERKYKDLGNGLFAENVYTNNDESRNDAFGRFRVANLHTVFDSIPQYGKLVYLWGESTTGSATSVHIPNENCISLNTTTASGDKVIRQTHKYHRYQPGKGQLIIMTSVLGIAKTNLRKRLGYFDAQNGVFFEQSNGVLKIVKRSYTTGTVVDTVVNQADWNIDKLDGFGKSGLTLDITKAQIFVIDLAWLGVGRVRYGFYYQGRTIYCHELIHENNATTVYMTTANLPLRYEIENTGTVESISSVKQICSTVLSEGGRDLPRGTIEYSVSNGITLKTVTTRRPILTIRPTATFKGVTNRGFILANRMSVYSKGTDCYYEVIRNGTLSGTPSWSSAGPESLSEFDVAASGITGGDRLFEGYVAVASGGTADSVQVNKIFAQDFDAASQSLSLSLNWNATSQDTITLVATAISGTANVGGCIDFIEIY